MRTAVRLMSFLVMFSLASFAQGHDHMSKKEAAPKKDATPVKKQTMAEVFDVRLTSVEKWVVPAADAMPADKYEFAPTQGEFTGVKTFTQQTRHIAATNDLFAALILGEKPPLPDDQIEMGPADMKSKDEIMKYLKDSYAHLHKALATLTPANALGTIPNGFGGTSTRLNTAILAIGHDYDHYGQMVEYLRMNGIIPPASRKK